MCILKIIPIVDWTFLQSDVFWTAFAAITTAFAAISALMIASRNRRHEVARIHYAKLQQVVEDVIEKLLLLNSHVDKYYIYLKNKIIADQENGVFIDSNDTLNKSEFEKGAGKVATFIEIYFPEIRGKWNECLECMEIICTQILIIEIKEKHKGTIDWSDEQIKYNDFITKLGNKPKELSDLLKSRLEDFRIKNSL